MQENGMILTNLQWIRDENMFVDLFGVENI